MKLALVALLIFCSLKSSLAQEAHDFVPGDGAPATTDAERLLRASQCVSKFEEDAGARRLCLDRIWVVSIKHNEGEPKKPSPPSTVANNVTLSSDAKIAGATYSVGDDPATFGLTREGGKTGSTIQVGMLYRAYFSSLPSFSPFAGFVIDRDTSTSDKTDIRQVIAGATYDPFGDRVVGESSVARPIFTVQARGRRDFATSTKSSVALGQANWYQKDWQGSPGSALHHLFLPFLGAARTNASDSVDSSGASRTFAYVGFSETYYPSGSAAKRLSLNVSAQVSRDLSVDRSYGLKTYKMFKAGVNYRINSSDNESVVPIVTVYRQVGTDLITGFAHRNRTFVGVGVKVDLP